MTTYSLAARLPRLHHLTQRPEDEGIEFSDPVVLALVGQCVNFTIGDDDPLLKAEITGAHRDDEGCIVLTLEVVTEDEDEAQRLVRVIDACGADSFESEVAWHDALPDSGDTDRLEVLSMRPGRGWRFPP